MFCPNCGKDNVPECKFCASCGINLEVVSRALYTSSVGFYTRFDTALNQLIARYSERVFDNAPASALSRRLSDSWKLLGEGFLTVSADFVLFWIMLFVVLPLRLLTLLVSTPFTLLITAPFRQLMDKGNRPKALARVNENQDAEKKGTGEISEWRVDSAISVVEHTTEHLPDYRPSRRSRKE
ncbi:MAG TPA: zinc ribbon domain-containing protein [Blastocatellia bacterium]|nr:zinc ribbon domain-containing protein [Blastocatellia bacterium]